MEMEYIGEDYSLKYIEKQGKCYITSCEGNALEVTVPSQIQGQPVVGILKKAFLSKRRLKRLYLPQTLEEIGDYAFAYCRNLTEIHFPGSCPVIGKEILKDCHGIETILSSGDTWSEEVGYLLAAAISMMDTYYLLTPESVGSMEWLEKWDSKMDQLMNEDDAEGYQKQILCGEEDYESTDYDAFVSAKRKGKVRLAMQRLLCATSLDAKRRDELENYVRAHTKGCESEESFEVLCTEFSTKPSYIQLFLDLGCVNGDNVEDMINAVGHEHTGIKAVLLRYQEDHLRQKDFFSDLSL